MTELPIPGDVSVDLPDELPHLEGEIPSTDTPRKLPVEALPWGRGRSEDRLLDLENLHVGLPAVDSLKPISLASHLDSVRTLVPRLQVAQLLPSLPPVGANIPQLEVLPTDVSSVLERVEETVEHLREMVTSLNVGTALGSQAGADAMGEDSREFVDQQIEYGLRTVNHQTGLTQDFTLPLCVPTPINVEDGGVTPTTLVSLCPVPLWEFSDQDLLPPISQQPLQLYMSVRRLLTGNEIPASFEASYDVPDPQDPTTPMMKLRFGISTASDSYPRQAVVGAIADYNPETNSIGETVTMSWRVGSGTQYGPDDLYIDAEGIGRVGVRHAPSANGGFLTLQDHEGRFLTSFHQLSQPPSGAPTEVYISGPVPGGDPGGATAVVQWRSVSQPPAFPQDFSFDLEPLISDGTPQGVIIDGKLVQQHDGFQAELEYLDSGSLVGRIRQTGFGSEFEEAVQLSSDAEGNPQGLSFEGQPGTISTLELSGYRGGQLAGFAQLVGIRPSSSEFNLQLHGSVSEGSIGASMTGSNIPAYSAAGSHVRPDGALDTQLVAGLELTTGLPHAPPPFPVGTGTEMHLRVKGVHPDLFELAIASTGTSDPGQQAAGVEMSGSTSGVWGDGVGMRQLFLSARTDPAHRVKFLFNSLTRDWRFKSGIRGSLNDPSALDVSVVNGSSNPQEFKQIRLNRQGSPVSTLTIRRPGSDMSDFITPAGDEILAYDPPSDFDLTVEKHEHQGSNSNSATQGVTVTGRNVSPAGTLGYLQLSSSVGSVRVDNEFIQQGSWTVSVQAKGSSQSADPDSIEIQGQQSWGTNEFAQVTALRPGVGQVMVRSLERPTTISVKVLRGTDGNPIGAKVEGVNGRNNPTLQVHLDTLGPQGGTQQALSILGPSVSEALAHTGWKGTATVLAVEEVFEFRVSQPSKQSFSLVSNNTGARPNMRVKLSQPAPASLLPGGRIDVELRSFDQSTRLSGTAEPVGGSSGPQGMAATFESWNSGSNLSQVISSTLRASNGAPAYTMLLHGPNGDAAGLPTTANDGAVTWVRMPRSFQLAVEAATSGDPSDPQHFEFSLEGAVPAMTSELRLTAPVHKTTAVFRGTDSSQRFSVKVSPLRSEVKKVRFRGTFSGAVRNVEIYRLRGNHQDFVGQFDGVNGNYPFDVQQGPPRGIRLYVLSPQTPNTPQDMDLLLKQADRTMTIEAHNSARYPTVHIERWFQLDDKSSCAHPDWGILQCVRMNLWNVPNDAQLKMTPPEAFTGALPDIVYTASHSSLMLLMDTLIPGLAGGMFVERFPRDGFTAKANLPDPSGESGSQRFHLRLESTEPLSWVQFYGYDVFIPIVRRVDRKVQQFGGYVAIDAQIDMNLNYFGEVILDAYGGIRRAVVRSDDKNQVLGAYAKGAASAELNMYFQMTALRPSGLFWEWTGTAFGASVAGNDWRGFDVTGEPAYWSFYTWEAREGNPNHLRASGCSDLNSNPGSINWEYYNAVWDRPIPYQPGLPNVINWLEVCAGHVVYYVLNPQDLVFKNCRAWRGDDVCNYLPEFSYWDWGWSTPLYNVGGSTDWMFAAGLKYDYPGPDPMHLLEESGIGGIG